MTRQEYRQLRHARGTQTAVAARLGISRITLTRRETGRFPITTEAGLALQSLPIPKKTWTNPIRKVRRAHPEGDRSG